MILTTNKILSQISEEWALRYSGLGNSIDNGGTKVLEDNNGDIVVGGSINNSSNNSDYLIIKYNTLGDQLWLAFFDGNLNDFLTDMVIDKIGNIYVTGYSEYDGQQADYLTVKYNSSGIQQWISRYNGTSNRRDNAYAIVIDSIGNTYVTGSSYETTTLLDFLTIKYDNAGQIIWVKSYTNENHNDEAHDIAVTESGNIYVAGFGNGTGTMHDYIVVKYDSSGNQIWQRRYDRSSLDDYCRYMAIDCFENVYLTGYTSNPSPDYTTIKYDSSGNVQWIRFYDAAGASDVARDIVTDRQNNVYVTGSSIGQGTGYDYVTIKYDLLGNEVWVSKYTPGNGLAFSIVVDENYETYVTGRADGSGTQNDYITVKYDSSGKQQWVARYDYSGEYGEYARNLAVDMIGNIYVTGQSNRDMLTVKYSLLTGLVNPFNNIPITFEIQQNYPNPFNPATNINYQLRATCLVELKVFDVLGNQVSTLVNQIQNAGKYEVEFDGSNHASGIYFYRLEINGNHIDTKRMILLK